MAGCWGLAGPRLSPWSRRTLSIHGSGPVSPDWPTGVALGVGGLAGAYTGARIQSRMPDLLIRRMVGVLVIAIGARYLWSGLA